MVWMKGWIVWSNLLIIDYKTYHMRFYIYLQASILMLCPRPFKLPGKIFCIPYCLGLVLPLVDIPFNLLYWGMKNCYLQYWIINKYRSVTVLLSFFMIKFSKIIAVRFEEDWLATCIFQREICCRAGGMSSPTLN